MAITEHSLINQVEAGAIVYGIIRGVIRPLFINIIGKILYGIAVRLGETEVLDYLKKTHNIPRKN